MKRSRNFQTVGDSTWDYFYHGLAWFNHGLASFSPIQLFNLPFSGDDPEKIGQDALLTALMALPFGANVRREETFHVAVKPGVFLRDIQVQWIYCNGKSPN